MPDRTGRFNAAETRRTAPRTCVCGGPTQQTWVAAGRRGDTEQWFRPGHLLCLCPERHL